MSAKSVCSNRENRLVLQMQFNTADARSISVKPVGELDNNVLGSGAHPDIIQRVYQLGTALPKGAIVSINGNLSLVHPPTATILSSIHGTSYALRLLPSLQDQAMAAGASTLKEWSDKRTTDIQEEAGDGWIWCAWYDDEPAWLTETYEGLTAKKW